MIHGAMNFKMWCFSFALQVEEYGLVSGVPVQEGSLPKMDSSPTPVQEG